MNLDIDTDFLKRRQKVLTIREKKLNSSKDIVKNIHREASDCEKMLATHI